MLNEQNIVHADDNQGYVSKVDPETLQDCISREVNIANQWYGNNGHQGMVLGKTDDKFSFPFKSSINVFGMNIDNKLSYDNNIQLTNKEA